MQVTSFVQQSNVCQHAKHLNTPPVGLLEPLPIPTGAWRDISMDFVEDLPTSEGFNVIMVIVDRYTKYAYFVPLKHPSRQFVDSLVKLHGMLRTIVSDRDKIFTSTFWKLLFQKLGTKLNYTTTYHPQSDGQTERINQCLEMFLRCMTQDQPKQWRRCLPLAEFWYNSTFHSSLGCSPFKALYGHDPNFGAMPELDQEQSPVSDVLAKRAVQTALLIKNLERVQTRMKHFADKHRVEKEFQVGEKVLLKLQLGTEPGIQDKGD
jgi:hypothetical protein